MSQTAVQEPKKERGPLNGVDTPTLFATNDGLTCVHALVATDLPWPETVFLSQNWKFTAPVYIGDTITAHAEVLKVHQARPVSQLAVRVTRQTGETVLEGEAWCYRITPGAGLP